MNISLFLSNPILWLTKERNSIIFTFHTILALISLLSNIYLIIWFYFLIFSFLKLKKSQKKGILPLFYAYLVPIEVFSRMLNCSPLIPIEGIKYLVVILLIYGIFNTNFIKSSKTGLYILLLSLPSFIFIPFTFYDFRFHLVASYLGFFTIILSIIYFSRIKMNANEIKLVFKNLFFSSLLVIIFSIITGEFSSITQLTVQASSKFTGGFGSNQVGSINGLCFGIIFLWTLFKIKVFDSKLIIYLLILFTFVISVLSFTRSSIITPILTILFCFVRFNSLLKIKIKVGFIYALAFIFLAFLAVNSYTNGSLLNRYAGETKATLSGDKEKTISSISNSRFDIMMSDLEMWSDNFIFGVGPGQSIPLRVHYGFSKKIAPHFEFSRLLSEHGIFGLIIILILLNHSLNLIRKKNIYPNIHLYLIFSLIFAILYTSHSATRLLIPSLLLGISFLNIKSNKNKLKSNLYDTKTN